MASRRLSDPPSDRSPERRLLNFDAAPDFALASLEETSALCDAEEYSEDDVEPLDTCLFKAGVRVCGSVERALGSGDCR